MTRSRKLRDFEAAPPAQLAKELGLDVDLDLLERALTHRSWAFEYGGEHNERLEFLGDSVLGLASTEYLFHTFPDLPESDLSKRRSAIVSAHALAKVARRIGLGQYIRLGKGAFLEGGREKESILADTTEAVIGAVHISLGPEVSKPFVLELLAPLISDQSTFSAAFDAKTRMQEIAAATGLQLRYEITSAGPEHARIFTAEVYLGDKQCGSGSGSSKKIAQQQAAAEAVAQIERENGA